MLYIPLYSRLSAEGDLHRTVYLYGLVVMLCSCMEMFVCVNDNKHKHGLNNVKLMSGLITEEVKNINHQVNVKKL
jgi:hypothetical protein